MKDDNSSLLGYGIVAVIAAVLIYSFWQFLVGGLAVFGLGFIVREIIRNNKNPFH
jgi:hypothetical protein